MPAAAFRNTGLLIRQKQLIMVYNFIHDTFEQYSFSDKVKAGIYEDFEIDFAGINVE